MKVGSLVECINDTYQEIPCADIILPKKGEIYTIDLIYTKPRGIGVCLVEIPDLIFVTHPNGSIHMERAIFLMSRFREIQPPLELIFIEEMQQTQTQTA